MKYFLRSVRRFTCFLLLFAADFSFAQVKVSENRTEVSASVHGYASTISLQSAVDEFNARAQQDSVGRVQPPLTSAEVIAALRALAQNRSMVQRAQYLVLQSIARTGVLPKGTYLRFIPGLVAVDGYDIDVWWVDIQLDLDKYSTDLADQPMHVYRIRTVYVNSRERR